MARTPKETPEGAGRAYESEASGSANENGKASATLAGGDPVNSPVVGNPGEARPDAGGYDYALAGKPNAATNPLHSPEVLGAPAKREEKKDVKYAQRVRAIRKGEYNGVKEAGEEFDNDRNLATYPEDKDSWFEAAE